METKPDANTRRWLNVEQLMEILPLKKSRASALARIDPPVLFKNDPAVLI